MRNILRWFPLLLFFALVGCMDDQDKEEDVFPDESVPVEELLKPLHTSIYVCPSQTTFVEYSIGSRIVTRYVYEWNGQYYDNTKRQEEPIYQIETKACKLVYDSYGRVTDFVKKDYDLPSEIEYVKFGSTADLCTLVLKGNTLYVTDYFYKQWKDKAFTKYSGELGLSNLTLLGVGQFCYSKYQ